MTTKNETSKIQCAICKKWEGHIIVKHLKDAHPKVSPFDYITEYDAPIASMHGYEVLKRHQKSHLTRVRTTAKVSDLFDLEPEANVDSPRRFVNREVQPFKEPAFNTPDRDEDYVFPEMALKKVLLALALEKRNRIWLSGYSGTGKTQLILQVANRMNYGVVRVQGDVAVTRRHLIGDWVVRNGETVWQDGVVIQAMKRGDILLIDEIDNLNPAALVILRGVLEDPSMVAILENGGEVVRAHPDFRAVATANTQGAGDETGLFVTSRALSLADRQRFSIWVKVDYLPPSVEVAMVQRRFPSLQMAEAKRFYQVVDGIRKQHKAGAFEESFSPRELINWVEKYYLVGDAMEAAQMCFIDRYQSPSVALSVEQLVATAWDQTQKEQDLPDEKPEVDGGA